MVDGRTHAPLLGYSPEPGELEGRTHVAEDWRQFAETLEEAVVTIIGDHYGLYGRSLPGATDLFADLGSDAIDALEVIMTLEECFAISLSSDDYRSVSTVGELVDVVRRAVRRKSDESPGTVDGGKIRDERPGTEGEQA